MVTFPGQAAGTSTRYPGWPLEGTSAHRNALGEHGGLGERPVCPPLSFSPGALAPRLTLPSTLAGWVTSWLPPDSGTVGV